MRHPGPTLAALALASLLAACGQSGSGGAPAGDPIATLSAEEKAKLLATLPAPYNTGDLAHGEALFALCQTCHTLTPGGANMTGPNLYGVFGRKTAATEGYKYSDALVAAGWTWDAAHLDQWLANPATFLPGTKMTFAGLDEAQDRVDLIAYLKIETGYKP